MWAGAGNMNIITFAPIAVQLESTMFAWNEKVWVIDFPLQAHSELSSDWMDDTKRITAWHYQNVEKGMLPDMLDNSVKIHQW